MRCSRCIFFFFFNFYEHCALRSNFEPRPRQRDFIAWLRRDALAFLFNTSPLDVSFLRKKSRFLYSRQNVNGRSRACVCEHGSGLIFFSLCGFICRIFSLAKSVHEFSLGISFVSCFFILLSFLFLSLFNSPSLLCHIYKFCPYNV